MIMGSVATDIGTIIVQVQNSLMEKAIHQIVLNQGNRASCILCDQRQEFVLLGSICIADIAFK